MIGLFFDTETTGLVNRKQTYDHPSQPRIIQLGALLVDRDLREIGRLSTLIRPDGFEIPVESQAAHGISTERALEEGIDATAAVEIFMAMAAQADYFCCHNVSFDELAMAAECHRLGLDFSLPEVSICTMEKSTNLCKIPGKYGFKWPKLQELHLFLFGEEFEDAHDAWADISATLRCFKELRKRGVL